MSYAEQLQREHKDRLQRWNDAAQKLVPPEPEKKPEPEKPEKKVVQTVSRLDYEALLSDLRAQVEYWKGRYLKLFGSLPQDEGGSAPKPTMPMMGTIMRTVCSHYGITRNAMLAPRRFTSLAQPRQIAQHLCCILTEHSLPQIGRAFHRDHTTIIHANRAVAERRRSDPDLDAEIRRLETEILADCANPVMPEQAP